MTIRDEIKFKINEKWQSEPIKLRSDSRFIYYDTDFIRTPNISSHTLVDMIGLNKRNSSGKTVMSMFGLLVKDVFNPLYEYRGGIAEEFAEDFIKKEFGEDIELESFTTDQFQNMNQFPEEAPFSGVLDLMMYLPQKMSIEVKSKSMFEYNNIAVKKIYPRDQITQGANQAMLSKTDKYMMCWVFFTPSAENLLKTLVKDDLWIWGKDYRQAIIDLELTEKDYKVHTDIFTVDKRLIGAYREKSLKMYDEFHKNRRIDKRLFTKDELKEIEAFISSKN